MRASTVLVLLAAGASAAATTASAADISEAARKVEAPIREVTVHGDRARVLRRAGIDLSAGTNVIALPDLPGGTWLDTVRVDADGATVARVETAPVERLGSGIERVEAMLRKIEALDAKLARIGGEMSALEQEISWLARITPAPLPDAPEAPRVLSPAVWPVALDFLDARRLSANERLRALAVERRKASEERAAAVARLEELNLGGLTQRNIEVFAVLESRAARRNVPVTLEYMVPGAGWKPIHELHFSPEAGEVTLAMYAQVRQASGEDWSEVKLALSTAMPARGIEMPDLLTWTLGEAREYVPVPRPKRAVPEPAFHAVPAPSSRTIEIDEQARIATLQRRLSASRVSLHTGETFAREQARPAQAPAAPRPPPAEMFMDAVEAEEHVPMALAESAPPRRTRAVRRESAQLSEPSRGEPATAFRLADPAESRRPPPPPTGSPAALAGGLDFVYPVAATAAIPATGEHHRVPLFRETFSADLLYEVSPGLMETAFLKATVRNTGARPILGGTASLFVSGSYAGDARLETIGPGERVELPLGADEDIRVQRIVIPKTVTSGRIRREESTLYTHRIEIASYKSRPVRLRVTDQIPKTRNESISIEMESITPPAAEGPTETEGLVNWEVELAPGGSTTLELRYHIRRPTDWQLFQR